MERYNSLSLSLSHTHTHTHTHTQALTYTLLHIEISKEVCTAIQKRYNNYTTYQYTHTSLSLSYPPPRLAHTHILTHKQKPVIKVLLLKARVNAQQYSWVYSSQKSSKKVAAACNSTGFTHNREELEGKVSR